MEWLHSSSSVLVQNAKKKKIGSNVGDEFRVYQVSGVNS